MIQLGQYAPPTHVIAHISDTHFLGGKRPLYGKVDTDRTLDPGARAARAVRARSPRRSSSPATWPTSAEPDAYERLKGIVEPAAERMGAEIIWVMGNHDERAAVLGRALRRRERRAAGPRLRRSAACASSPSTRRCPDTTTASITDAQLDWLRDVLAEPAPDGTLLALHHPPIPSPIELMAILELEEQHRLADVIRGTDVRAILAGHLHYSTSGTFAGIPVSVAAATCYTIDNSAPAGSLVGIDGGQSINLVHVYEDSVVHSIIPVLEAPQVAGFSGVVLDGLAEMTPEERREAFSNKKSTFNVAEAESSALIE